MNTGQAPTLLKKFERKPFNHLFWSPSGQFMVLANLGLTGGALEFLDTNDFTVMNVSDHYQVPSPPLKLNKSTNMVTHECISCNSRCPV